MGKYKRYKNRIEKFLSGDSGKRFFNFAYSIGAAIVILGALFKILHLPGGNFMLSVGMGVEVMMFLLTAFDRPAKEYNWEEVFPVLSTKDPEDRPEFHGGQGGGVIIKGGTGATGTTEDRPEYMFRLKRPRERLAFLRTYSWGKKIRRVFRKAFRNFLPQPTNFRVWLN